MTCGTIDYVPYTTTNAHSNASIRQTKTKHNLTTQVRMKTCTSSRLCTRFETLSFARIVSVSKRYACVGALFLTPSSMFHSWFATFLACIRNPVVTYFRSRALTETKKQRNASHLAHISRRFRHGTLSHAHSRVLSRAQPCSVSLAGSLSVCLSGALLSLSFSLHLPHFLRPSFPPLIPHLPHFLVTSVSLSLFFSF